MKELKLQELKTKTASDLINFAKENGVRTRVLKKTGIVVRNTKQLAEVNVEIIGEGVIGNAGWFWFFKISRCELFTGS